MKTKRVLLLIVALVVVVSVCLGLLTACGLFGGDKDDDSKRDNGNKGDNTPSGHVHEFEFGFCKTCGDEDPNYNFVPTNGLEFELNEDRESYKLVGLGTATNIEHIVVPSTYNNLPVTVIADAFDERPEIKTIKIPDSVKLIDEFAFDELFGFYTLVIPDSVEKICDCATQGCINLRFLRIGRGLSNITDEALCESYNLELIIVSPLNTTFKSVNNCLIDIEKRAVILGCAKSIIPTDDSVTSIASMSFFMPVGLTSIIIPANITNIEPDAFYCMQLVEVYNKSSINLVVGDEEDTTGLCYFTKNIYTAPNGSKITTDSNGFVKYSDGDEVILVGYTGNLKDLIIPEDITGINNFIFYLNDRFNSIQIPDSVTGIGDNAFCGCANLTSITIPGTMTSIGDHAFDGCTGLTSVTIPDSMTSISAYTFCGCTNLTSITIPSSVTSIGHYAFGVCRGLISINYGGTMAQWNAIEKSWYWNDDTGNYTVHCTDGDVAKA